MDDLISREAAIAFANEQIEKETGAYSKGRNAGIRVMKSALNNPDAIPSVPAVPLDKLCEWLADKDYMHLSEEELDNGWSSHDPAYWEMKLSKWMEEQNA